MDVKTLLVTGVSYSSTDHGIMVGLRTPDHPSDLALKFIDALRRGGLEVSTVEWSSPVFAQYPLDFDLFIGPN
jgi:hypothetical protein